MENLQELLKKANKAYRSGNSKLALELFSNAKKLSQNEKEKLEILKSVCVLYDVTFNEKGLLETSNEFFILSDKIKNSGNIDSSSATNLSIIRSILSKRNMLEDEVAKFVNEEPIRKLDLIAIGYWKSDLEPHLPHPRNFQVKNWNQNERQEVINYLKKGTPIIYSRGMSWCRFNCKSDNIGSSCLTDGIYIFPEGLVHYLENHDVKLPNKFIKHAKKNKPLIPKGKFEAGKINYDWWIKSSIEPPKGLIKRILGINKN